MYNIRNVGMNPLNRRRGGFKPTTFRVEKKVFQLTYQMCNTQMERMNTTSEKNITKKTITRQGFKPITYSKEEK